MVSYYSTNAGSLKTSKLIEAVFVTDRIAISRQKIAATNDFLHLMWGSSWEAITIVEFHYAYLKIKT